MKTVLRARAIGMPLALPLGFAALILLAPAARAEDDGTIRVVGHPDPEGLLPDQSAPAAISGVGVPFITKQAPTLNAFQLVNLLPGANVSSTDPFGLSATSSLTLRGLAQDSIGVLLEGAPQNDIGYYYAYPAQFADAENLSEVTLRPGAAAIAAPVVNAVGGVLAVTLDAPHDTPGVFADVSVGSYNERRGFVRVDSGHFAGDTLRAFLSYSNNRADNWRGPGFDTRQHIDAKIAAAWGAGNTASLAISYNDANTSAYASPTLADWQAQGRRFGHGGSYARDGLDYWRLYRQPFRNLYASAPVHLVLSDSLSLDSTTYVQRGFGNAPYGASIGPDGYYPGTVLGTETLDRPVPGATDTTRDVLANFTGDQFRTGEVLSLTWRRGAHALTAGAWFDRGVDHDIQSFTPLDAQGQPLDGWGKGADAIRTGDGRLYALMDIHTTTVTKAFFVADSMTLAQGLTLDLGFKGVNLLHSGRNLLPGTQGAVRANRFAALPRASLHWQASARQQFFANVTTSFRAPDQYALYDNYDGYGGVSSTGTDRLRSERSIAAELGWRWQGRDLSASVTGFGYAFRNRLVATVAPLNGALVNTTINAGRQHTVGVDGEIDWRPAEGVSLYLSGEWLHARLQDDLPVGEDFLPTRGKRAVQAPEVQFGLGGTYDDTRLFGSVALKYVGRQYATLVNDESIPGYATLDVAFGVHFARPGAPRTDLRVNLINLTDPRVLSGVEAVTANARDTMGRRGSLIAGSAPGYYIGAGRAVAVTLAHQFR